MSSSKLVVQGAAGALGGAGLNVEEVFSTYLYEGGTAQQINNGLDLDTEGGMVWIKRRNTSGYDHQVFDTERIDATYSTPRRLSTNGNAADDAYFTTGEFSFLTDGFNLNNTDAQVNGSGGDYTSWTFRKAPKFFDVVTYTGSNTDVVVNHNLGTTVGTIIVKNTSTASDWYVWHRSLPTYNFSKLNATDASSTSAAVFKAVTDTSFTLGGFSGVNAVGDTFVAYLFAHNDGDGEFGPDADADIIKCGSFNFPATGDVEVDLGWEPQWVLAKRADSTSNWWLLDSMRGWEAQKTGGTFSSSTGGKAEALFTDNSNAEASYNYGALTSTGFKWPSNFNAGVNTKWVYIAIRRGQMAVPEDADDVFHIDDQSTSISEAPRYRSGFVTDFYFWKEKHTSTNWTASARLLGTNILKTNLTSAQTSSSIYTWDFMEGALNVTSVDANKPAWMWKRAPNYFDAVAYIGDKADGRTVSHNLGVAPEMIWIKQRDVARNWAVYHSAVGATKVMHLDTTNAAYADATMFNDTEPTASVFTVDTNNGTNASGGTFIAYLFASLDGVSKVGSYTGNGNASGQNIDCGFSSGARFVLIKTSSVNGSWNLWDSTRGIVAGDDPYLQLNSTDAEYTNDDYIDPYSAGFNAVSNMNVSGREYIFYAIA